MKEEMEKDEGFIIRTYEKAELAHLYNPNMPLVSAMRKLRAWIRRNRQLTDALTATGENKRDHSYTPPASVTHRGGAGRTLKQASFR